jgi:hypothetical protein
MGPCGPHRLPWHRQSNALSFRILGESTRRCWGDALYKARVTLARHTHTHALV